MHLLSLLVSHVTELSVQSLIAMLAEHAQMQILEPLIIINNLQMQPAMPLLPLTPLIQPIAPEEEEESYKTLPTSLAVLLLTQPTAHCVQPVTLLQVLP